ncbi:MAG: hypothetical protein SF182_08960, partial [Deltaproteobacteria bacterium]|nr:hypothetical protein [Deltaproteobacteria bacterium]
MHRTPWIIGGALLASVVGGVAPRMAAAKSTASCAPAELSQRLASTGLDADGSARARWRQDDRCRAGLSIELEDVPVGDYVLLVGDVERGRIAVAATLGGTRGTLELESPDDTPHPATLDVDPRGAVVVVRGAAGIYFADTFDGSAGGPAATPVPTRTALPRTPTAAPTRAATGTPAATRTDDRG